MFFMYLCKLSSRWKDVLDTNVQLARLWLWAGLFTLTEVCLMFFSPSQFFFRFEAVRLVLLTISVVGLTTRLRAG